MFDRGSQFQHWYRITLGDRQLSSEDGPRPLSVSFNIETDDGFTANNAELELVNLAPEFRSWLDRSEDLTVQVEAGYVNGAKSTIFLGALRNVFSTFVERTWRTRVSSGDGEKELLRRANVTFPAGTPYGKVLRTLVEKLGVGVGNVDTLASVTTKSGSAALLRAYSASGGIANELRWFASTLGIEWSIQQGEFVGSLTGLAAATGGPLLTPTTGLVGDLTVNPKGLVSGSALLQPGMQPKTAFRVESPVYTGTLVASKVTQLGDYRGAQWHTVWEGKPPK